MAGKVVSGAGAGTALGASLGSVLPGLGTAIGGLAGAVGGAVVGVFEGVFSSKKHYHLYYWDPSASAWKFAIDGHPSQVKPLAASYQKSGLVTAIVRNKDDKAADGTLAPKNPPAGYSAAGSGAAAGGKLNPWILGGILAAGGVLFLLVRRKR